MTPGRNDPCPCGSGKKHKHCCWSGGIGAPGGNGSDGGSTPTSDYLAEVRAELLRQAAARPDASVVELQRSVANPLMKRYNHTPQTDLGGLSPSQVRRLMDADWALEDDALFVRPDLPFEEVGRSRIVRNARRLLEGLGEEGIRATARGNLNRAFVQSMLGALEWPRDYPAILEWHRTNEEDVWPLHTLRVLLEIAGLLKCRRGRFSVIKRRQGLLGPSRAGELLAHLFVAQFREMSLGYLTWDQVDGRLQQGVAYSLYRFHVVGHEWRRPEELVEPLLLPFVRESLPESLYYNAGASAVENRFLRVLEKFGLAEVRTVSGESPYVDDRLYRKAPLFDRLLSFGVSEP